MKKLPNKINRIAWVPDTQIRKGVKTDHLEAYANYITDKRPQTVIVAGDWWDMPSLSSYDKPGSDGWEYRNLQDDYDAGNEAMDMFLKGIKYKPELHFLVGNHEDRITRASKDPDNRRFRQFLSFDKLNLKRFKVHPFLKVYRKHGVAFSHYFTHGPMDRPMSSLIHTQIRNVGCSFVAGHNQNYQVGQHYTSTGQRRRGIICGSFYQHNEEYLSTQGNARCWRGALMLNDVKGGDFDITELSISYLLKNWL